MPDAALSAFSVFFMQSPSFLDYQRTMQEIQGKSNVQTLFGTFNIPTDNPIRSLLDPVEPSAVYPMFPFILKGLQQAGIVDSYRSLYQTVLLALDGTSVFFITNVALSLLFHQKTQQRENHLFPYSRNAKDFFEGKIGFDIQKTHNGMINS